MPKPKTKLALIEASRANYDQLLAHVDALSGSQQTAEFKPGTMNRNIRDVFAHLHHWHGLFLNWYEVGMTGEKPEMPAPGYTWKTLPALNREIWDSYRHTPLPETRAQLQKSFADMQAVIARHTDDELFTKRHYGWTGSTSLGAYLISATSSHYGWAFKLIRKAATQDSAEAAKAKRRTRRPGA